MKSRLCRRHETKIETVGRLLHLSPEIVDDLYLDLEPRQPVEMFVGVGHESLQPATAAGRVGQRQQHLAVHVGQDDVQHGLGGGGVPAVAVPLDGVGQQLVQRRVVQAQDSSLDGAQVNNISGRATNK